MQTDLTIPTLFATFQKVTPHSYLWMIALFPLIGAAINGILGKQIQDKFGKKANHTIAIGAMLMAFLVAVAGFTKLLGLPAGERVIQSDLFPMINVGDFRVHFSFVMDQLSGVMALIITGIGTMIHVYSTGYMSEEKSYWRFFCYLNLFIFAMLLLVMGDSFIMMFFGWEGVGLCSYLLIGFWYTDFDKATAGMKAFVVNRVGDFAFVSGLFLLFWSLGGSWDQAGKYHHRYDDPRPGVEQRFEAVTRLDPSIHGETHEEKREHQLAAAEKAAPDLQKQAASATGVRKEIYASGYTPVYVGSTVSFLELQQQLSIEDARTGAKPMVDNLLRQKVLGIPVVFLVCFLFFIGACGKSAQIPLYVWLPDAMAGPTPVSALIHAATMVTAGVYMIARLNFLFYLSPGAMSIVAFVGACTALFAATMGLFQYDIKKVLAYSTVSQLGFMFIGVGVGAWWVGVFHLLTHACFKACLFLGSGSVIHGMHFLQHHDGHDDHGDGHGADGAEHADDHGHGAHDDRAAAHPAPKSHAELRLAPDPTDPQDMRNMGGLKDLMPKTRLTYMLACLAIAGFPIAAGFYSKDEILWKAMSNGATVIPGWLIWAIGYIAAGCTSFYMYRSYYMTFYRRPATDDIKKHCHESPGSMTYVLWVLAVLAVVTGLLGLPHWAGFHPVFEHWLAPVMEGGPFREIEGFFSSFGLEMVLVAASIGIAFAGWYLARFFYLDESKTLARMNELKARYAGAHRLLYNKYWVDEIYQKTVVRGFDGIARACSWFDAHIVDWAVNFCGTIGLGCAWLGGFIDRMFVDGAVNGVATVVMRVGSEARKIQTGKINNYALGIAAGLLGLGVINWLFAL